MTISSDQEERKKDTGCINVVPDALMKLLRDPDNWVYFKEGGKADGIIWLRHKPSGVEFTTRYGDNQKKFAVRKHFEAKEPQPYVSASAEEVEILRTRFDEVVEYAPNPMDEEIANKLLSSWIK